MGPDEARCLEQVALRFPLHHDPLCAMGAPRPRLLEQTEAGRMWSDLGGSCFFFGGWVLFFFGGGVGAHFRWWEFEENPCLDSEAGRLWSDFGGL